MNRTAFIDFCQGLLNLDPMQRWTPQQARMHPFITGEKFTKPFVVCFCAFISIPTRSLILFLATGALEQCWWCHSAASLWYGSKAALRRFSALSAAGQTGVSGRSYLQSASCTAPSIHCSAAGSRPSRVERIP